MIALPDVVEELEDSSVTLLWNFLQQLVRQSIVTAGGRNLAGAISLHLYRHTLCDAFQLVVRLPLAQVTRLRNLVLRIVSFFDCRCALVRPVWKRLLVGFLDGLKTGTYCSAASKMAPMALLQLVVTSSVMLSSVSRRLQSSLKAFQTAIRSWNLTFFLMLEKTQ